MPGCFKCFLTDNERFCSKEIIFIFVSEILLFLGDMFFMLCIP